MGFDSRYEYDEPIGEYNGNPIWGGGCWLRTSGVYVEGVEKTNGRYAQDETEFQLFGAHLPDEVVALRYIETGCVDYQGLISDGVPVHDCPGCPLRQSDS